MSSNRNSRSRSKTPLIMEFDDGGEVTTRVTRSTTYKKSMVDESASYVAKAGRSKTSASRTIRRAKYITSDYSSEDNDNEVSSSNSDANSAALRIYRQTEQYWNAYPKTDYTYSPHSKDRIEIAPGVVNMPNMSRKSIRNSLHDVFINKETNTETNISEEIYRNNNKYSVTTSRKSVMYYISTSTLNVLTFILVVCRCFNDASVFLLSHLHKMASRVMLTDTWLLRSTTKQSFSKYKSLASFFLAALLFFGGLWLLSNLIPLQAQQQQQQQAEYHEASGVKYDVRLTDAQISAIKHSIISDLSNQLDDVHLQLDNERAAFKLLFDELAESNREAIKQLQNSFNMDLNALRDEMRGEYIDKSIRFMYELRKCCRHSLLQIDRLVDQKLASPAMRAWMQTMFVAKDELDAYVKNVSMQLNDDLKRLIEDNQAVILGKISESLTSSSDQSLNLDDRTLIQTIVKQALRVYDADKTGMVDYALESAGGEVISIRCTEVTSGYAVMKVFGIPLWSVRHSPRSVITGGNLVPGMCWSFIGFPGYLVIKLWANVTIDAFAYEHIAPSLIPTGRSDSAPRSFTVFGLREEHDRDPVFIGDYIYRLDGDPLQFFNAQTPNCTFNMIELRINSNHGNPNYTTLYRFRVHGRLT